MRSIVIGALFDALPAAGVTCLRFNFRGVEGSEGAHDEGRGEQLDVRAAIAELDAQVDAALPMLLAGWSFGADIALATVVDRVGGVARDRPAAAHGARLREPSGAIRGRSCSRSPSTTSTASPIR